MGTSWSQEETVELDVEGPKKLPKKLPHNYQAIINEADTPLPNEPSRLYEQLQSGVFLNQKKKKYWIEEKTGYNCFMLFARGLSIAWADNQRHWSWFSMKETSDVDVDVANLLNVCWLEVDGIFETSNLSPNTGYEVAFVVMVEDPAYGWEVPVTLKLACPDGSVQERKERLKERPRGQWMELNAGEFQTSVDKGGQIQFTLLDYHSQWKKGLVVKGAVIRPKNSR
ncbi:protein PHLOEM PROTEIN 2-LIKE A1-like [Magnolia sinica]|uniref:protein PHLOEM PROTEIN 2-LIKE A1-like n=1 Tax=Magnolia sinica TaxID=86752 RepID=UPI0026593EC3|nr:protein PHLOEM PROTEIN 2-LIKE A1-like [Magnolia sinica]